MSNQKLHITQAREADGPYELPKSLNRDEIIELALQIQFRNIKSKPLMSCPSDVMRYFQLRLACCQNEVFSVMFLSSKNQLIDCLDLFQGNIDSCTVHIRGVVVEALKHNAAAVIVAHNHPSGVVEPSRADECLTESLKAALSLVSIRLLDHIVVGDGEIFSFAETGRLD